MVLAQIFGKSYARESPKIFAQPTAECAAGGASSGDFGKVDPHPVALHELGNRLRELVLLRLDGDAVVFQEAQGFINHTVVQSGMVSTQFCLFKFYVDLRLSIEKRQSGTAFFHRFLGNTNTWICRILEFRKKNLEFGKKILEFREKNQSFYSELP